MKELKRKKKNKKSKKANNKSLMEIERARERESLVWGKMFLQLCGRLRGTVHQQSFWLFNFSSTAHK